MGTDGQSLGIRCDFPSAVDSKAIGNTVVSEYELAVEHEVILYDDTLRDGEQTIGVAFKPDEQLEIAEGLLDAGIKHFTAGFPAISPSHQRIAEQIMRLSPETIACFARSTAKDIEVVVECGAKIIILFIPISDCHLQRKLKMSVDDAYDRMQKAIELAVSAGLTVRYGLEDASRTPVNRVWRFIEGAVDAGASIVGLADTCGVLTPLSAYRFLEKAGQVAKGTPLTVHFHNDFGMAVANTVAGLSAGARFAQAALLGLGERAGNASLEELAAVLELKYGVDTGVDLDKLCKLAYRVSEIAKFPVAPNKPLLGRNVFAHESGIHVHGLSREPACYEPFPPRLVGRTHEIYFGKHSGLASLQLVAQQEKLQLDDQRMIAVLSEVKRRGEEGRSVAPDEVRELLHEAARTDVKGPAA